jgi:hypothetical protein
MWSVPALKEKEALKTPGFQLDNKIYKLVQLAIMFVSL